MARFNVSTAGWFPIKPKKALATRALVPGGTLSDGFSCLGKEEGLIVSGSPSIPSCRPTESVGSSGVPTAAVPGIQMFNRLTACSTHLERCTPSSIRIRLSSRETTSVLFKAISISVQYL